MEKRLVLSALGIFLITFLMANVSASFLIGNKSAEIEKNYAPGDKLKGWVNISLKNESRDSLFYSSFNIAGIKLIDFLTANFLTERSDFVCSPAGCGKSYISTNGQEIKSFSLNYLNEKLVSFKIFGSITGINSLSFDVSVDNDMSCMNPLEIDILDDEALEWKSNKLSDDFSCVYEELMGCFNPDETLGEVILGTTPYCEKIRLPPSGKFSLGAWIKKGSTSWNAGLLSMKLFSLENSELASCALPEPSASGGEISCIVNYDASDSKEHYVCVKASGITDYKTKTESINPCGFYAIPGQQEEEHDYYIFGKAAKFANIGKFTFNQAEYNKQGNTGSLSEEIFSYINEKYNRKCQNGCSIPVKFRAFSKLNIEISNLSLSYSTGAGLQIPEKSIYDATTEPAKISSGFLMLDVGKANITLPTDYGKKEIILYLSNNLIVNETINIAQVPVIKSLAPNIVPAAVSVKFNADASAINKSIITYKWDFGDGSEETTTTNSIRHTYLNLGAYTLKLTVTDEEGLSASKEFSIIAGNPKDAVNNTLKKYKERITNITKQVESYPEWYKNSLSAKIGIADLAAELTDLEKKFGTANTDEEYVKIMSNLTGMKVPYELKKSSSGTIPIAVNSDDISLENLKSIGAGGYKTSDEQDYRAAIAQWAGSNLNLEAEFFTLSAYYDQETLGILNYFKLRIEPISSQNIENYLVINDKATFNLKATEELDGAVGARFSSLETREVEFVTSPIPPFTIAIYLSPEFNKLDIPAARVCELNGKCEKERGENWKNCRADCKPIGRGVFYFLIALFLSFVSYIILQEWYKRKYENYLFKNRNELFNLINFINNALTESMEKGEIEKRLRSYGWSSEQVSYAFKKVRGKRVGMPFEIRFPPWKVEKGDRKVF